jgi:hypothetical protein
VLSEKAPVPPLELELLLLELLLLDELLLLELLLPPPLPEPPLHPAISMAASASRDKARPVGTRRVAVILLSQQ